MDFIYRQNSVAEDILSTFIEKNLSQFHPSFSELCINTNYSHKLYINALTFEVWSENILVGLICAYFNSEQNFVYVPYVCVSKIFSGKGLASSLFDRLFEYCKNNEFVRISLEVRISNTHAYSLYRKLGFLEILKKGDKILMEKKL